MHLSKLLVAAASATLIAAPILAEAATAPMATNPAAPLSLSNAKGVKSSSRVRKASNLAGTGLVLLVLAGAAAAGGIAAAASGHNSSN